MPERRSCLETGEQFTVTDRELAFLDSITPRFSGTEFPFPVADYSPETRLRRLMAFRNERCLFQRICDRTGDRILSVYPPTARHPVIHNDIWWSKETDNTQFAREFDFTRPFFEQIAELIDVVPRMHLFIYSSDRQINSDYINCAGDLKDCYLIFGAARDERCYHSHYINDSYGCVDNYYCMNSTHCFDCVDVDTCNTLFFSQSCKQCAESYFLYDCRGCTNCIGCVGLRQKEYHLFNRKVSKQEFEQVRTEILAEGWASIDRFRSKYEDLLASYPRRPMHGDNNENSSGDFIWNTKNCYYCFDMYNAEDCLYCTWFADGKDCMDYFAWGEAEKCYQVTSGGDGMYGSVCCSMSYGARHSYYLDLCMYCQNCFGCVGLTHERFSILNTRYSEKEYFELLPRVIAHLQDTGEWGKFFPPALSTIGYSHSVAQQHYPLSQEEATERGYYWEDYEQPSPTSEKVLAGARAGKAQAHDRAVLDAVIKCDRSQRLFRLVAPELEFLQLNDLPLPRYHPDERHRDRVAKRNPRRLWKRKCQDSGEEVLTSYPPDSPVTVLSEAEYLKQTYGGD